MLYSALGWDKPVFAHVPNVLGTDGKKLSKRRGAKSVLDYRAEGYLSGALLNYLMLLGYSPKDDREIFSKEEIEKEFSLDKINVAPAIFDERKLLWMNGEHIRQSQNSKLKSQILEFDPELEKFDRELIEKLIEPAKTRMKTLTEFRKLVEPFISKENKTPVSELKSKLAESFEKIGQWNKENILEETKKYLQDNNIKFPDLYETLIGVRQGLPLPDVFEILGKEKTLKLLQ
jgi:glutamyl/glutaminyl-tRNA synthetase